MKGSEFFMVCRDFYWTQYDLMSFDEGLGVNRYRRVSRVPMGLHEVSKDSNCNSAKVNCFVF